MKKKEGTFQYSRVVICFLLLLLLLSLFSSRGLVSLYRLYWTEKHLKTQILEVKARNAGLRQEIASWQDDLGKIEKIARDELGMVKPGEVVYQF